MAPACAGFDPPGLPERPYAVLAPVSQGCPPPQGTFLRAPHPSAADARRRPRDLHVLSMPPAFALSQDQTLRFIIPAPSRTTRTRSTQFSLSPRSLAHSLEAPLPAAAPPRRARRHDRAHTRAHAKARPEPRRRPRLLPGPQSPEQKTPKRPPRRTKHNTAQPAQRHDTTQDAHHPAHTQRNATAPQPRRTSASSYETRCNCE
jgi:hypothetical protein